MFNNISWSEYLTFVAVSALIWYVYVLFTYYRYDLLQVINGKRTVPANSVRFTTSAMKQPAQSNPEDYQPKSIEANQSVESFTDEVKAYLEEAGQNEVSKDILLQSLSAIASKYSSLAESEYKDSLEQFIINQTEINCAVFLGENEVSRVWSGT